MDINKLRYFISVVENDYNITKAAEKQHITQPALSKFISTYEDMHNTKIFDRKNNRLIGLTPAGECLIDNAKIVLNNYDTMVDEFNGYSSKLMGKVRIGIPPLVQTVLTAKVMAQLVKNNLDIHYEIEEVGAFEMRNKLLLDELDVAIILGPTNLNELTTKQALIFEDQLTAFIPKSNKLAQKKNLEWTDLNGTNLILYNNSFMVRQLMDETFKSQKIIPNTIIDSKSWDFMLELVRSGDFITILPSPIANHANMDDIVELKFNSFIKWEVFLAYPIKTYYSQAETYVRNKLLEHFL